MIMTMPDVVWDPPGPGRWEPDPIHWPKPAARAAQAPFAVGTRRGIASAFTRHGLPFQSLEMAFVNDVLFQRITMCDAVELARREWIAQHAREVDQWRADADHWLAVTKPARLASNLVLQDLDPFELSDDGLVEHLRVVVREVEEAVAEHMDLVCVGDVVGRLLVAAVQWGIQATDALALLSGSSPGSAEAAVSANWISARIAGRTVASIEDARALSDEMADVIDEHLRLHGWRMVDSYGPDGTTLAEQPEVLLRSITAPRARPAPDVAALEDAVRRAVPEEDRERFDAILADARSAYGVRDDNEGLTLLWPMGLLRRALLAAGSRLTERGALSSVDGAFAVDVDELAGLLGGAHAPTRDEVDERVQRRVQVTGRIPAALGEETTESAPEVPVGILPTLAAAEAVWGAELVAGAEIGTGIGTESYIGRACVCADVGSTLEKLELGDVLITTSTTSAFNAILTIAGALVVEVGGPACHSALIARELGLPAVVGLAGATATFRTGDRVCVDPVRGTVTRA